VLLIKYKGTYITNMGFIVNYYLDRLKWL